MVDLWFCIVFVVKRYILIKQACIHTSISVFLVILVFDSHNILIIQFTRECEFLKNRKSKIINIFQLHKNSKLSHKINADHTSSLLQQLGSFGWNQ